MALGSAVFRVTVLIFCSLNKLQNIIIVIIIIASSSVNLFVLEYGCYYNSFIP